MNWMNRVGGRPAIGDMALAGAEMVRHSVIAVVEKMEKVYPEWVSESVRCIYDDGFEDCRKTILALLQKGEAK